jgi:hypothetical protein
MVPGPPNPDGTPGPMQSVQRTRTSYTFEMAEWQDTRTVTASGTDRDDVRWPQYALMPGERVRKKAETYWVTFTASAKEAKEYEGVTDETQWRAVTLGATYRLTLGLLGGVRGAIPI